MMMRLNLIQSYKETIKYKIYFSLSQYVDPTGGIVFQVLKKRKSSSIETLNKF
jgi:hypothetical protein